MSLKLCAGQYINPKDVYYVITTITSVPHNVTINHKMY